MIRPKLTRRYTKKFAGYGADYTIDDVPIYGEETFWREFLETWLPHFDTSELSLVKINEKMGYGAPDGHFTCGIYYDQIGAIVVPTIEYMEKNFHLPMKAKYECKETFFHEMIHHMHHVHDHESAERCKNVDSPEFRTVSERGADRLSEGFAELGAKVLMGARYDPYKENFFEEEVGTSIDELVRIRHKAKDL